MELTSAAFENGGTIPQKYGLDFENTNPPLSIAGVPEGARSLVLFMDDPDVPAAAGVLVWDHWIVFNIPPSTREIPEHWKVDGVCGKGTRGEIVYTGPRPPDREHRYFFKLSALDADLDLQEGATKSEVEEAMRGHVLGSAELMGRFAPATPRTFWKDAFGWGFLLWFFGYAMGMLLFTLVPPGVIGWIIMPIGTLVTLWVLIKKVRGGPFFLYVAIAAVWLFIAVACDYLFLVLLFKLADGYYKASVYIYYALMALLPVFVGWYKVSYVSRDTNT